MEKDFFHENDLIMIKSILLIVALSLSGCALWIDEPYTPNTIRNSCVIISDDYGEREVCTKSYYTSDGNLIYWDANFGIWVGRGGYWRNNIFYRGYHPGFYNHYQFNYQNHGYYYRGGIHGGFIPGISGGRK